MVIRNDKKILHTAILAAFFLLIVGYSIFRSHYLLVGVKIKDVNIEDGAKFEQNVIELTGNAKNAVNLTLNGREISINQDGDFNETFALLPGYNIVSITAKDKFGYTDEKNYRLVY